MKRIAKLYFLLPGLLSLIMFAGCNLNVSVDAASKDAKLKVVNSLPAGRSINFLAVTKYDQNKTKFTNILREYQTIGSGSYESITGSAGTFMIAFSTTHESAGICLVLQDSSAQPSKFIFEEDTKYKLEFSLLSEVYYWNLSYDNGRSAAPIASGPVELITIGG